MPSRYRGGLRSGRFKGFIQYYKRRRVDNLQVCQPLRQWQRHYKPFWTFLRGKNVFEFKGKVHTGKRPFASEYGYVNHQK